MTTQNKGLRHSLKEFDEKSLKSTARRWSTELAKHEKDLLAASFEQSLAWAQGNVDYADKTRTSFAYGVFEEGASHADAIVNVVYRREAKKWVKMMDVFLSPEKDLAFFEKDHGGRDISELYSIFGATVIGTVKLTAKNHPSKVVKLFARSAALFSYFTALAVGLRLDDITVTTEGRWLVLKLA